MAAEELITLEELRGKPIDLEDRRTAAERALEEVQGRAGRISELERDREGLLATYEAFAAEEIDDLSTEERHDFYRTLRMIVYAHPEGGVEVTGEFMPFGEPDPRDPPSENGPGARPVTTVRVRWATTPARLVEGFPQIKTRERAVRPPGFRERAERVGLGHRR